MILAILYILVNTHSFNPRKVKEIKALGGAADRTVEWTNSLLSCHDAIDPVPGSTKNIIIILFNRLQLPTVQAQVRRGTTPGKQTSYKKNLAMRNHAAGVTGQTYDKTMSGRK